jgi:hypothetical protein
MSDVLARVLSGDFEVEPFELVGDGYQLVLLDLLQYFLATQNVGQL